MIHTVSLFFILKLHNYIALLALEALASMLDVVKEGRNEDTSFLLSTATVVLTTEPNIANCDHAESLLEKVYSRC